VKRRTVSMVIRPCVPAAESPDRSPYKTPDVGLVRVQVAFHISPEWLLLVFTLSLILAFAVWSF
jgi:hypothetical protein